MLIACAVMLMWASPAPPQPSPESTVSASNVVIASAVEGAIGNKTVEPMVSGMIAAALPAAVAVPAVAPPKQFRRPGRAWWALTLTQHGAAGFDAWSTRYSVNAGGRELNPLMRPFVNCSALYPAIQAGPAVLDYLSLRMMRSRRPWMRRMWWAPQAVFATGSVAAGFHNIGVGHRLEH